MYHIAICDSKTAELDKVERMLQDRRSPLAESEYVLKRFTNTKDLIWKVEIGNYRPDILLMDISASGESGIEMVRKMQSFGGREQVIFFASSPKYAFAAFDVAVSYLLKPVSETALYRALDRSLAEVWQDRYRYVLFEANNHICRLELEDIIYCEAHGKKQCVYLRNGEYLLLRSTMTKLREALCVHKGFVGIGVSYIVNLGHVEGWDKRILLLDNGQEIYLPRGAYRALPAL